ncbi:hypothetical protein EVAR_76129_1 [Eumeta japonica]|uniref:Uncharacterized protein n=1 Tax=Eumeta variegata TaxID=151549 RepID=A0A4C1UX50_EUMVA|nr:hypothetical protein EVAR_76129_1 [Eumeta japonica]
MVVIEGSLSTGTTLCKSDGGGSLSYHVWDDDGSRVNYLRGVASIAPADERSCNVNPIGVFTHVLRYKSFLEEYLKEAVCFCYICGEYTVKSQQRNISDFVKKVYFAYFHLILGDQDKPWAPHKVCRRCEEDLRLWFKHVKGFDTKNEKKISYPNLDSAIRPVSNNSETPVPHPPPNLDYREDGMSVYSSDSSGFGGGSNSGSLTFPFKQHNPGGSSQYRHEAFIVPKSIETSAA